MCSDTDLTKKEVLQGLRDLSVRSISEERSLSMQVCIIAGAIAAFSMPLYASPTLSFGQHALVGLAIASLLSCILLGVWELQVVLRSGQRELRMRLAILEDDDYTMWKQFKKERERVLSRKQKPNVVGLTFLALFTAGIILLLAALVCNQWRTYTA